MYVCFNGIQQYGHLLIVLHTCNIPSSGERKLSTVSGCRVSSVLPGKVLPGPQLLTLQYGITPTICYLAQKVYDFTKWQTEKEITYIWRHSVDLVLYWHLKDSGYSSYKTKIDKGETKHSLHLATEYEVCCIYSMYILYRSVCPLV